MATKHRNQTITETLNHGHKPKVSTRNCRGLAGLSKRQQITQVMKKHNIDILPLQETKQPINFTQKHDGYTFYFPGKIHRAQAHGEGRRGQNEHHGVGFITSPQYNPYV